jgi:hypothetical protein
MSDYDNIKEQMKTADCLLFSSFSPIASGIKMFTNSQWSHSALVIRLSEYEGEERHRFYVEATAPVVKLTRLSAKMEDYTGYIAWLPLPDYYDDLRKNMGHLMLELLDKKYDYKSILKQAFGRVSADANSFFCSELCGWVWGIHSEFFNMALRPADIPGLNMFKDIKPFIIYDGRTE